MSKNIVSFIVLFFQKSFVSLKSFCVYIGVCVCVFVYKTNTNCTEPKNSTNASFAYETASAGRQTFKFHD